MALPAIRRRRSATTSGIPASLPIEIQPRRPTENSTFTIAPKTSLVDRTGLKVPSLPAQKHSSQPTQDETPHANSSIMNTPSSNGNGNRSRSKSISSVARDRTYAARDVSHMRDPGEALFVPEEEEEEDVEDGINEEDKGLFNAYKILARQ